MDGKPLKILVIEDDENDYKLMMRALKKESLLVDATRVDTSDGLNNALRDAEWDVVISDSNLPDSRITIPTSLQLIRSVNKNTPFIIVSGTIGEEVAVELMKLGVSDYLLKGSLARLGPTVKRELSEAHTRHQKLKTELNLIESEERYRLLANSIKDMFFALDKNLTCTFWNATAESITQTPASKAIGKTVYELFPHIENTEIKYKLLESINTLTSQTIEVNYIINGAKRYYHVMIYPSPEIHSVIIRDVTSKKNTEEKLKSINDELETFMYRVSHDIRGPVASLRGLINIAQGELFENPAKEYFEQTGKVVYRLEAIVKALLDATRIRQNEVSIVTFDTESLFIEAKLHTKGAVNKVMISLDINAESKTINTDPKLLIIVLEKIFQNAVDYRNPTIESHLKIMVRNTVHETSFTFEDNGIGIRPEVLDKVFKMFYRGSENSKGSGLGLYLAKSAIEKLGGSITVSSIINDGSIFIIRLPKAKNALDED